MPNSLVKELPIEECAFCGGKFRKARADQRFCSNDHNRKFYRRREGRAVRALEIVLEHYKKLPPHVREEVEGWMKEKGVQI
jgi:hypothetical protein